MSEQINTITTKIDLNAFYESDLFTSNMTFKIAILDKQTKKRPIVLNVYKDGVYYAELKVTIEMFNNNFWIKQ